MGLFSSLGGAVGMLAGGPIGASIGSSAGGYIDGKNAADYQWKRQKRMFNWQTAWEQEKMQNGVQWQMQDMKKAGINPLVAGITGGATGSGAPSPSAPSMDIDKETLGNQLATLRSVDQQDRKLDIDEKNADTNRIVGTAQAGKNVEETKWIEPQAKADIQNKNTDTLKKQAETDNINAETSNIQAEKQLINEEIASKQYDNLIKKGLAEARSGNWGKWYAILDDVAQLGNEYADIYQKLKNAGKNLKEIEQYTEEYTNIRGNKSRHRRTTYR